MLQPFRRSVALVVFARMFARTETGYNPFSIRIVTKQNHLTYRTVYDVVTHPEGHTVMSLPAKEYYEQVHSKELRAVLTNFVTPINEVLKNGTYDALVLTVQKLNKENLF